MESEETKEDSYQQRSEFIRKIIQQPVEDVFHHPMCSCTIPKKIIQFWDLPNNIPDDVRHCMKSWSVLESFGYEYFLYDLVSAKKFIKYNLGKAYSEAFAKCTHPAMQSDYFRLCYISVNGGLYVDTDDVYLGSEINGFFMDDKLKIQPLCYDISTDSMISPEIFTEENTYEESWIFYFNNNPLIAPPHHIIIDKALEQSTYLLNKSSRTLTDIQSTTGPGNLSKSIFSCREEIDLSSQITVVSNWQDIAETKWDLEYRADSRNWRLMK
ncbi:glycosyltransferase family 32 protein [Pluralibacter gergoviae]|uniref:glycosyltransferase family 32 protein n=1 Tax=Pluralibacter gergoviae TaxID=61647 RepID=UPI0009005836|nr:glycosyltransferase [Pluralibacter gergoviae]